MYVYIYFCCWMHYQRIDVIKIGLSHLLFLYVCLPCLQKKPVLPHLQAPPVTHQPFPPPLDFFVCVHCSLFIVCVVLIKMFLSLFLVVDWLLSGVLFKILCNSHLCWSLCYSLLYSEEPPSPTIINKFSFIDFYYVPALYLGFIGTQSLLCSKIQHFIQFSL